MSFDYSYPPYRNEFVNSWIYPFGYPYPYPYSCPCPLGACRYHVSLRKTTDSKTSSETDVSDNDMSESDMSLLDIILTGMSDGEERDDIVDKVIEEVVRRMIAGNYKR